MVGSEAWRQRPEWKFDLPKRKRNPTVPYVGQIGPDEQLLRLVAEQADGDKDSL